MRSFNILVLIGVVFFFTTGSSIIDNETKTSVSELSYKLDRLVQLEHAWNTENKRLLREQKDAIQQLTSGMEALNGHLGSIKVRAGEIETAPSTALKEPASSTAASLGLLPLFPYIISGVSVALLIALFVRVRRSEAEFRKRLWKNEMTTLRDELAFENPTTPPPNPKIHVTGEFSRSRLP